MRLRAPSRFWIRAFLPFLLPGAALAAEIEEAQCEVTPLGAEAEPTVLPCAIRQEMGFITIRRADGVVHELRPAGDKPGIYMDQRGSSAYVSPIPDATGFFFRFADESVEIRWSDDTD